MIHFISSKHCIDHEDIKSLGRDERAALLQSIYATAKVLAIDCETNGMDPYENDILLISIADEETSVVLDRSCFDLLPTNPDNFMWVLS